MTMLCRDSSTSAANGTIQPAYDGINSSRQCGIYISAAYDQYIELSCSVVNLTSVSSYLQLYANAVGYVNAPVVNRIYTSSGGYISLSAQFTQGDWFECQWTTTSKLNTTDFKLCRDSSTTAASGTIQPFDGATDPARQCSFYIYASSDQIIQLSCSVVNVTKASNYVQLNGVIDSKANPSAVLSLVKTTGCNAIGQRVISANYQCYKCKLSVLSVQTVGAGRVLVTVSRLLLKKPKQHVETLVKLVVKLFDFSRENTRAKLFCVSTLAELLLKGATAFCLESKCEIITSSEDILSDYEVLFLLNDQSEALYIREIKKGNNVSLLEFVGVVTNELVAPAATKENEPIKFIVIAAEPTFQLNQEIIGPLVGPVEEGVAERIKIIIMCSGACQTELVCVLQIEEYAEGNFTNLKVKRARLLECVHPQRMVTLLNISNNSVAATAFKLVNLSCCCLPLCLLSANTSHCERTTDVIATVTTDKRRTGSLGSNDATFLAGILNILT
ncbi:hypothetical protein DAPPUDRAFT_320468 [Daphnia pulex]|uniref:CUB domain-containing protein n=1 Tax=Daphnia pulex TaxID=6669 RepID=E9GPX8_DAPPU|nr:hypothetical protein DAPPUDRAFT_320468 [Daphnia pulex]|eukprot:EFX78513.1 hypothetical protein DAPPUDRAFT_320468 [Daphnia pulex]